jgi:hypothetical protein
VSEQEHEQREEESPDEREETLRDLDVPEEEGKDVAGGRKAGKDQQEYY